MSKFDRFWEKIFTAPEAYNIDKIVDLSPYGLSTSPSYSINEKYLTAFSLVKLPPLVWAKT